MWVADRGSSSAQNRRELRRNGGHCIIGEKLRSGSAKATAALSRQCRYPARARQLQVEEVRIADDERFVICFIPSRTRPRAARARGRRAGGPDRRHRQASTTKRAELRGRISTLAGPTRFLRTHTEKA